MRGFRAMLQLLLWSCLLCSAAASNSSTSKWKTLSGRSPSVIAYNGFSGLFPACSAASYNLANMTSVSDVILWCNVQLTKDAQGICFPNLLLGNGSNVADSYKNKINTYSVNGVSMNGYFTVDFTMNDLANVFLTQGVYSRTFRFDGSFEIQTVEAVAELNPPGLWLNFENNGFFEQHNLSMRTYVLSIMRSRVVSHISSTDGMFLSSISSRINPNVTKLILKFLEPKKVEPFSNQTYEYLLQNLASVKKFAVGILIPKAYIWPLQTNGYLGNYTSIVMDAHKQGLEVFASDFANDVPYAYNFHYDPIEEYLHFIDNGYFSVDGVLSDFPITPSAAINCFANLGKKAKVQEKPLVITHNGASGTYAPCTDLAYTNAISDGANFIDCMVQVSKDGILLCLTSVNLLDSSNLAQTRFMDLLTTIEEIHVDKGICSFDLTWSEIRKLTPQMYEPYAIESRLWRNPNAKDHGKFLKLSEFLDLAKNSSLSGVLIGIENAAYHIEKRRYDIIGAVIDALRNTGYSNQSTQKVIIQSSSSAVLQEFKGGAPGNYELAYNVHDNISDVAVSAIGDIAKVAHSVVIRKKSVYPTEDLFTIRLTDVVQKFKSHNLSVYVHVFVNEFLAQAWDFFSDATVEINTFVMGAGIDGVITEYPATTVAYKRNRCLNLKEPPIYMSPVSPGSLLGIMSPSNLPPAQAPFPALTANDVADAPLPDVPPPSPSPASSPNSSPARAPTQSPPNAQPRNAVPLSLLGLAWLLPIAMVV